MGRVESIIIGKICSILLCEKFAIRFEHHRDT
jgi:hypothetical protein